MSNLASMIMEGTGFGRARLTHSYDHENGAGLIAMESAEALRDIFEAEFYIPNTCTIQATLEGASCVAESSQAAIMEASIKGAFEKIKPTCVFINGGRAAKISLLNFPAIPSPRNEPRANIVDSISGRNPSFSLAEFEK